MHDPIFAKIDFSLDVDGRRATLNVPGIIESRAEPIQNPVTGDEHRVCINLPHGFEYTLAEVGRGWTNTSGAIALNLENSHAHFAHMHMTQSGRRRLAVPLTAQRGAQPSCDATLVAFCIAARL